MIVEVELAKKILDLDVLELSKILTGIMHQHQDAYEDLKEAVEDAV